MKKYTGIRLNANDAELQTLYVGIDRIYGGWLLTTCGDPTCLNEAEDASDEETIRLVDDLVEHGTPEDLDDDDIAYVEDVLDAWGI